VGGLPLVAAWVVLPWKLLQEKAVNREGLRSFAAAAPNAVWAAMWLATIPDIVRDL
jgi:hypothetical protein